MDEISKRFDQISPDLRQILVNHQIQLRAINLEQEELQLQIDEKEKEKEKEKVKKILGKNTHICLISLLK